MSIMGNNKKFIKIDTSKCHLEDYWENGHHCKYWIENETEKIIIDAKEKWNRVYTLELMLNEYPLQLQGS